MMKTTQVTCGLSEGPCRHKKHGGGMRKLLKQKGKRRKSMENENGKIDRGMEGVQEEYSKCKEDYFLSNGKETEGMCKRFK